MANPLYLFFASKAGMAATVLRLTIALFLLQHVIWQSRVLLDPSLESLSAMTPFWIGILTVESWGTLMLNVLFGLGLLLGLFTRLFSFILLVFFLYLGVTAPMETDAAWRELLLSGSLCLALTIAGGGYFSIDRKVSEYLLPTFG